MIFFSFLLPFFFFSMYAKKDSENHENCVSPNRGAELSLSRCLTFDFVSLCVSSLVKTKKRERELQSDRYMIC